MFYLKLNGKEIRSGGNDGQIRRWEIVRETAKAVLVKEHQTLLWNGEVDEEYESEAWLPKAALHKVPGTGFYWVESWALRGKNIHPLEAATYEYGTASDELAVRQIAAIEAGEGVWK